jgi:hypothetical protein
MARSNKTSYIDYIKGRAHAALARAIKDGTIVRQPCEVCGNPKAVAHHDNYLRPLDVRFLCRSCHARFHAPTVNRTLRLHQLASNLIDIIWNLPQSTKKTAPALRAKRYLYAYSSISNTLKQAIDIQNARNELAKVVDLPASYYEIPSFESTLTEAIAQSRA